MWITNCVTFIVIQRTVEIKMTKSTIAFHVGNNEMKHQSLGTLNEMLNS